LAQLPGTLPDLPAQIPKLGLLGLAAAAPLFGQGALLTGLGAGLVMALALLGDGLQCLVTLAADLIQIPAHLVGEFGVCSG
jgi:hypothetical protein